MAYFDKMTAEIKAEFVLSTNANNRNIDGEIALGGGYYLKFDIKGNGSNIKEFKIIKK